MAAIDKIYVNSYEKYKEFEKWLLEQPKLKDKYGKEISIYAYFFKQWDDPKYWDMEHPIFSAPIYVDAYIIRNCPFDYIQEELMLRYGHWSQERLKSYYESVKNWDNSKGESPYWAKLEDFVFDNGVITIKDLEESDYSLIKKGLLYNSPKTSYSYTIGKHFKCTKHPVNMFNTPFKCKIWFIDVIPPQDLSYFMYYHNNHNSWDFPDEFVICDWSSSTAHCKTIKALKRLILKWKLPVGSVVKAAGRYVLDNYEFIVKK